MQEDLLREISRLKAENARLQEDLSRLEEAYSSDNTTLNSLYALGDTLKLVIAYIDQDQRYLYANRKYGEILGIHPEEIIGKHIRDVVGEDFYEMSRSRIEAALSGETFSYEGQFITPTGSAYTYLATYSPDVDSNGKCRGMFVTAEDTTEYERRKIQFSTLLQHLPEIVGRISTDMRILYVNDRIRDTGADRDPALFIGRRLSELPISEDAKGCIESVIREVFSEGTTKTFEIEHKLPARTQYYNIRVVPEFSCSGNVESLLAIAVDVSEYRILHQELNREKQRAEEANRAKTNFLASMSHEIRTPISGILGMTEFLMRSNRDPAMTEYLRLILGSARALHEVVGQVLDLSKIEAGKLEVTPAPFSLRDEIEQSVDSFLFSASQKGVDLNCSIESTLPDRVTGDRIIVGQILRNLLSNAVKFTDSGEVGVHATATKRRSSAVNVEICVSDTGCGIPEHMQSFIFQDFYQANNPLRKVHSGSGLGLSITKKLAEACGGMIRFESREGSGSTFILSLPFQLEGRKLDDGTCVADRSIRPENPLSRMSPMRVLLAEDDRVNRIFLENLLQDAGHSVTSVQNGKEAVRAFQEHQIDIILMDVQMPEMDGLEASREIRRMNTEKSRVPILGITAFALRQEERQIREAGMDDYIIKPLDISDLAAMMNRLASPSP